MNSTTDRKKEKLYEKLYEKNMLQMSEKYYQFLKIIKNLKPKRYLDLGCGDGSFSQLIKKNLKCQVYGVDIASKAVKSAKKKNIKAYKVDVDWEKLPFNSNYFDCVYTGEIIEHLYDPDHYLKEIYRVLKRGGKMILTTPNLASWYNRFSLLFGYQPIFAEASLNHSFGHLWYMTSGGTLRLYTFRTLKRLIETHSFKIIANKGLGINNKIGFGKKHPFMAKLANFIFQHPSLNSGILIMAEK